MILMLNIIYMELIVDSLLNGLNSYCKVNPCPSLDF